MRLVMMDVWVALSKEKIFWLIMASMVMILNACDSNSAFFTEDDRYRQIAWNSLTDRQKETVIIDVSEAKVKRDEVFTRYNEDGTTDKIPAVSVRFNTSDDALLGPILVYVSPDNNKVLGQGLRF